MLVGERRSALLVRPQNFLGGEGNGQEVPQSLCLAEELDVTGMDDVVATGDKDMAH